MQNLIQIDIPDNRAWRKSTLDYLLKRWKSRNPERKVRAASLLFVMEKTPPPGRPLEQETLVLASSKDAPVEMKHR